MPLRSATGLSCLARSHANYTGCKFRTQNEAATECCSSADDLLVVCFFFLQCDFAYVLCTHHTHAIIGVERWRWRRWHCHHGCMRRTVNARICSVCESVVSVVAGTHTKNRFFAGTSLYAFNAFSSCVRCACAPTRIHFMHVQQQAHCHQRAICPQKAFKKIKQQLNSREPQQINWV